MVERESVCLRRLAGGRRSGIVGYGRFLANERVSVERLVEGWGAGAAAACAGRHVLAIQDTSEIIFSTRPETRRGLGLLAKGRAHGLLLHAMLAVDADDGGCLGLVGGRVWTRGQPFTLPPERRPAVERESDRWLATAETAKRVLAGAATVTVVADRESDIYAEWATLPEAGFHLLTRALHDRRIRGGKLSTAVLTSGGEATASLKAKPGRPAREARLHARFGRVEVIRPKNGGADTSLPRSLELSLVEVVEREPPAGAEPVMWRLLTTHAVPDAATAWRIVDWYRARWAVEQLFRTLKQQGLKLEDSQVEDAERLLKLTAIATLAACTVMQLTHARDGRSGQPAALVFSPPELAVLEALVPELEGRTAAQKNPHPPRSLAWATWVIAKLGGWDGYASSKPPGPITLRHGLQHFQSMVEGWALRDV